MTINNKKKINKIVSIDTNDNNNKLENKKKIDSHETNDLFVDIRIINSFVKFDSIDIGQNKIDEQKSCFKKSRFLSFL